METTVTSLWPADSDRGLMLGGLDKAPSGEVRYQPFPFVEQRPWLAGLSSSPNVGRRPASIDTGNFSRPKFRIRETVREAWLDDADPELHDRPPGSIKDHEKARLPDI